MSHTTNLLKRIDWLALREQKEYVDNEANNNSDAGHIYEGLLNLLDMLMDAAVKDGIASEVEVFGPEDEDATSDGRGPFRKFWDDYLNDRDAAMSKYRGRA